MVGRARSTVTRALVAGAVWLATAVQAAEPAARLPIWPGTPPGETKPLPPEADQTKPNEELIAGRRIIRLGNVSTPEITVYRPEPSRDTGAAVVICPGGGFWILAMDLEGTEVAAWLNSIGVTGIVLKYRVPYRHPDQRWLAAVQDGQRAVSLVRSRAAEWKIDPTRIGMLGFSAGGTTASYTSLLFGQRQYAEVDAVDRVSSRPDFTILIYTGGFADDHPAKQKADLAIPKEAPPMFLVHAFDDKVSVDNTLLLASRLKQAGGSAEVHMFDRGGHGYGLRPVEGRPVTQWPELCVTWMRTRGLLRTQ